MRSVRERRSHHPRWAAARQVMGRPPGARPGDLIEKGGPVGRLSFRGTETDSIALISGAWASPHDGYRLPSERAEWPGDIFFLDVCRAPSDYGHQVPPSHFMGHFSMVSQKFAGKENASVEQCFECHNTTSWNDIVNVGFYKHH